MRLERQLIEASNVYQAKLYSELLRVFLTVLHNTP